jgi:hypothetical protein
MLRQNLEILSANLFVFDTPERISISQLHPFPYDSFSLPPCQLEILIASKIQFLKETGF